MTDQEYLDFRETVLRNRFIPIPPAERNFVTKNYQDFLSDGVGLARALTLAGLQPNHSVLDLGCGLGRLALPLTQFLSNEGSYFGIDINLSGVAWCHENITIRYPNFQFAVINARNRNYRAPHEYGQEDLAHTWLPIPQERRFDVICAFSLFTHLKWEEVDWYFHKVSDRLANSGVFVGTFFLMSDDARLGIRNGKSLYDFDIDSEGPTYLLKGHDGYSRAISHDDRAVMLLANECGMETN
jgi:SAM-dependent methyltransferase